MNYLSVCSGIEAATSAWHGLGWEPFAFSEIEPFPSAVLAHHYPNVPNLGDMTKFQEWPDAAIDLLVGGTPCQSFSVAGLRKGLADPRGNLMLTYGAIAAKYRPTWLVWENVPGVLSSSGGKDFGTFLGMLAELGYGFAYRVLDAQYFGVAQRRRRVFVVGYLGDWRRAAAVLFERHSLSGHPAPSREAGQGIAGAAKVGVDISHTLTRRPSASGRLDVNGETFVTHSLRGEGFDASEDGTGRGTPLVPVLASTLKANNGGGGFGSDPSETFVPVSYRTAGDGAVYEEGDATAPLTTGTDKCANIVAAFKGGQGSKAGGIGYDESVSPTLGAADSGSNRAPTLMHGMKVRRLAPRECERLQGFPDDFTLIPVRGKPAADGPRYKALGNSMAVPVMAWIGGRIQQVSELIAQQEAA